MTATRKAKRLDRGDLWPHLITPARQGGQRPGPGGQDPALCLEWNTRCAPRVLLSEDISVAAV